MSSESTQRLPPNLKATKTIFYRALIGFIVTSFCFLCIKWLFIGNSLFIRSNDLSSHISLVGSKRSSGYPGHILIRNMIESGASTSDIASMSNFFNKMYTGTVLIGTPSQQFSYVVFDTGSADLWVLSDDSNINENYLSYYASTDSSTYTPSPTATSDWKISYGTGEAQGTSGTDIVVIAGLAANDQIFAQATYVEDMAISEYEPQDGICGFARSEAATLTAGNTIMQTLMNNDENPSGLFAFYLSRHSDSGSKFIIGADTVFNTDFYYEDEMETFNVTDEIDYDVDGLWAIHLTQIKVQNNYKITPAGSANGYLSAIFDTGTTYIGIPEDAYDDFMKQLTRDRGDCYSESSSGDDVYVCQDIINPTKNLPTLEFTATNAKGDIVTMKLEPADYLDDSNELGFMPLKGLNIWIMGDSFLKNYYSVYDYSNDQIHLAPSKYSDSMISDLMTTVLIIAIITVAILLLLSCIRYFVTKNQIKYLANNALLNQQADLQMEE